ncbi:hypothetical protein [Paenibacillus bouchesdurhonensis]|uniref:hypothetical protein n=1 Tax=Paenibacillus bouchesdurhonensis TaxID=1870990 RepID=UPI000DA6337B|nr:hypothetical protein [Paenibacillus bouchesdurhonensis]
MSLWNDSPRMSGPPQTEDVAVILDYVKQLANTVAKMAKDLEFILNGNVAFDNIRAEGIEAKNIKAEAITTDKLHANSVTTNKIQAGAVTAEKITVNKLSAISANLGIITAGLMQAVEIFGSYIATRRDGYPRCEMSATGNVFAARTNVSNYIAIDPNYAGVPSLDFYINGSRRLQLNLMSGGPEISSIGSLNINTSGGNIYLVPTGRVWVESWDKLYSDEWGRTLKEDLVEIFDRLEALGG